MAMRRKEVRKKIAKKRPRKKVVKRKPARAVIHTFSTRPKKTVKKLKDEVWFVRDTPKQGCEYYVKVYGSRREVYDAIHAQELRERQPTPIRTKYYRNFDELVHDLTSRAGFQSSYIEIEPEGHVYNPTCISPFDGIQYGAVTKITQLHRRILDTKKTLWNLLGPQ